MLQSRIKVNYNCMQPLSMGGANSNQGYRDIGDQSRRANLGSNLHECVVSVHHDVQVLSEDVVNVCVPQVGKRPVRDIVEREVASVMVQLAPLVIHSPFVQQLSDKPLFIASYDL